MDLGYKYKSDNFIYANNTSRTKNFSPSQNPDRFPVTLYHYNVLQILTFGEYIRQKLAKPWSQANDPAACT